MNYKGLREKAEELLIDCSFDGPGQQEEIIQQLAAALKDAYREGLEAPRDAAQ